MSPIFSRILVNVRIGASSRRSLLVARSHPRAGLASEEPPKSPGGLVRRDQELARVRELLEAVRSGLTGGLVVEGEAGIGKTSLLAAAEELADGFTCLWARGWSRRPRSAMRRCSS